MRHHARLFIAESLQEADLEKELFTPGEDVVHVVREKLSIADARAIKNYAYQRPVNKDYMEIVVFAGTYLCEAQNALLKLLEEPPVSTRLTIVVKDQQQLLSTVRSRLAYGSQPVSDNNIEEAELFLSNSFADRLAKVDALAKAKDAKSLKNLIQQCAIVLSQKGSTDIGVSQKSLTSVNVALTYAQINGASNKMLLEYVSLMVPVMKTK